MFLLLCYLKVNIEEKLAKSCVKIGFLKLDFSYLETPLEITSFPLCFIMFELHLFIKIIVIISKVPVLISNNVNISLYFITCVLLVKSCGQ